MDEAVASTKPKIDAKQILENSRRKLMKAMFLKDDKKTPEPATPAPNSSINATTSEGSVKKRWDDVLWERRPKKEEEKEPRKQSKHRKHHKHRKHRKHSRRSGETKEKNEATKSWFDDISDNELLNIVREAPEQFPLLQHLSANDVRIKARLISGGEANASDLSSFSEGELESSDEEKKIQRRDKLKKKQEGNTDEVICDNLNLKEVSKL